MTTSSETPIVIPNSAANPRLNETRRRATFVDRQERVLQGVAGMFGAFAVEAWLLNDDSTQLHRTFAWEGSNHVTLDAKSRELAQADADLAALAGGAVVLEKPEELVDWSLPRQAVAAICLPISSDTTIHGSLWYYFDRQRTFNDQELEILEIVAGRIAVEIERDEYLREIAKLSKNSTNEDGSKNHSLIGELQISTWNNPEVDAEALWARLPSGQSLAFSSAIVGETELSEEDANEAIALANRKVHKLSQQHSDAGELLNHVNHELFDSLSSGVGLSLSVALLNGEGEGTYAMAGPGLTLRVRAATTITNASESTPLGWDLDAHYESSPLQLNVNERLLLLAGTPQLTNPILERGLGDQFRALTAESHRSMSANACIETLLKSGNEELSAVAAVRRI